MRQNSQNSVTNLPVTAVENEDSNERPQNCPSRNFTPAPCESLM